jgi:hypothetical protein
VRRSAPTPKRLAQSLLFAAGVAGLGGAAAQTPRIYSISVPMEIEYDSNPNMVLGNAPSTTWFRVRPSFTATQVQDKNEYSLDAALSAEKSSNPDIAKDRLDPRLAGRWKHADGVNTTLLSLLAERQALRTLDIKEQVPRSADGSRTLYSINGAWTRELSDRMSFTADLRQDWDKYTVDTTPDDRLTYGAARLTRLENERRSWYGLINAQLYRSDLKQTAVGRNIGGTRSNMAGAMVGVNQLLSSDFRVDASVGVMHFDEPITDNDWQGALRAEYVAERWSASAEMSRYAGVNSTVFARLVVTEDFRLRTRYAINSLTRLDFDIGHNRQQVLNSKNSLANLILTRQWSPSWEVAVRATIRQQEVLGGTAKSNLVALLLVYRNPDF